MVWVGDEVEYAFELAIGLVAGQSQVACFRAVAWVGDAVRYAVELLVGLVLVLAEVPW